MDNNEVILKKIENIIEENSNLKIEIKKLQEEVKSLKYIVDIKNKGC